MSAASRMRGMRPLSATNEGTDWTDCETCHGLAATSPALRTAGPETGEA